MRALQADEAGVLLPAEHEGEVRILLLVSGVPDGLQAGEAGLRGASVIRATYKRPAMGSVKQKWEIEPHIVARDRRDQAIEDQRVRIKAVVFKRDGGMCRCCKNHPAIEMHELKFRSLGGRRSRENSIAVCTFKGENCHRRLQQNIIVFHKLTWRGAGGPLEFHDRQSGRTWLSLPPNRVFKVKGVA